MGVLIRGAALTFRAVQNDIRKLFGMTAQGSKDAGRIIVLTPENSFFADDLLLELEGSGEKEWLFTTGADITSFGEECAFNLAIFFDKLSRMTGISAEKKIYYRYVAKCIAEGNDVPFFDGFPGLKPLTRRCIDFMAAGAQKRAASKSLRPLILPSLNSSLKESPKDWKKVLITGWYGTETTGDKAILAELVRFINERSPSCEILLTTMDQKISRKTNREVEGLSGAGLVEIRKGAAPDIIDECDAVIIGGGPLMQSDSMGFIRKIFLEANRRKKARVIFGCGMGPFHTKEMESVAADIVELSTASFFRDEESCEYAARLVPGRTFVSACDPAIGYIKRWAQTRQMPGSSGTSIKIATLLRANTGEFSAGSSRNELKRMNGENAEKMAGILRPLCENRRAEVEMLAMNAHWIGGDDRIFNRLVASHLNGLGNVTIRRDYQPLKELAGSLSRAQAAVAMRYHGHLFCLALGIPFLSIDYTGKKGKVHSLVRRIGYENWAIPWSDMDGKAASEKLIGLIDGREEFSARLRSESDKLAELLENTYDRVFGQRDVL